MGLNLTIGGQGTLGCYNPKKGESHYKSNLSKLNVESIFQEYNTGKYTMTDVAKKYNIKVPTVQAILNGKTWKHLGLEIEVDSNKIRYESMSKKQTKYSEKDCIKVLDMYSTGNYSSTTLGQKLKVPASTIRKMICGKMFPHLDREGVKDIASINIKNNKNYKN